MTSKNFFSELESVSREYAELALPQTVFNYEKYRLYQIVGSSTRLEGATLTDAEVEILLEQGRTAPGKLLEHHLMVQDNFRAMQYALSEADKKTSVSPLLLQSFNAHNVKQTGSVIQTILGNVDMTRGEFRVSAVKSDALGYYEEASKVPGMVDRLCASINKGLSESKSLSEQLICAFDAHSDLVLIHPWYDGNKRTSRLLMNYIERYFGLPLTTVHKEDVHEYLSALKALKDNHDRTPFHTFMFGQHIKTLKTEIDEYRRHLGVDQEPVSRKSAPRQSPKRKRGLKL